MTNKSSCLINNDHVSKILVISHVKDKNLTILKLKSLSCKLIWIACDKGRWDLSSKLKHSCKRQFAKECKITLKWNKPNIIVSFPSNLRDKIRVCLWILPNYCSCVIHHSNLITDKSNQNMCVIDHNSLSNTISINNSLLN